MRWWYTGSCGPICPPHRIVDGPAADLEPALLSLPVKLSTMGRGYAEDRAYFLSAAAAGRVAAGIPGQALASAALATDCSWPRWLASGAADATR